MATPAESKYEKAMYTADVKSDMTGIHSTLVNDNYVNKFESSISMVETQFAQSRFSVSLSTPSFGSTSQAYIPTSSLVGETYLIFELAPDTAGSKWYLPDGWGLRLIENLTYTMPGDNIGNLTITNDELFHYLYCQTRDYCSMIQLLKHAGPVSSQGGNDYASAGLATNTGANWCATVLLPLPWSTLGYDTKPLDAMIFGSGQINITISLAQLGKVAERVSGNGSLTIKRAQLTYRQGNMTNMANSLKFIMMKNPGMAYDMPYIRSQYKSIGPFSSANSGQVTLQADGSYRVNTFISGMLDSDLVGMCISVHPNFDSGKVGNPYETIQIFDLNLEFSGLSLYRSDRFSHRLYNFQSALSAGYDCADVYRGAPTAGDPTPGITSNFPHIINFSRLRSMNWADHYFNVQKFASQTFNLSFSTPASAFTPTAPRNGQITVRITLFYNAVMALSLYKTQQILL